MSKRNITLGGQSIIPGFQAQNCGIFNLLKLKVFYRPIIFNPSLRSEPSGPICR